MSPPGPARRRRRWPMGGLRWRLVFILCVIITMILFGQAVLGLSGEVAELDGRVATQATILAQSFAAAAEGLVDGDVAERFGPLLEKLERAVDLVEAVVVDRHGRVLAHTDPVRVGEVLADADTTAFGSPQPDRGWRGLFTGDALYRASAPMLRGTRVLGYVHLAYRSSEVADRAVFIVVATTGWAMVWLLIGGVVATLYVRHITEPLAQLTEVAEALGADRLDAVDLVAREGEDEVSTLQQAFVHLVESLRAERTENARLLETVQGLNERLQQRVVEVSADLRRAHEHLESVIGALEEGVVSCTPDGTVVQVNAGARKQLAGLGEPRSGASVASLLGDGEALLEAVRDVVASGEARRIELSPRPASADAHGGAVEETRDRASGGTVATPPRQLVFQLYPMGGAPGAVSGVVITVVDETERRQIEVQLRRNDRLISLGTIAAGLAHELGNHMHIIHGFSGMLLERMDADDPRTRDVRTIHDENAHAVELLHRFLQFARPGAGTLRPAGIDALVQRSVEVCGLELRKHRITVVDALTVPGAQVECDGHLLQQVFINLILNAVDAMKSVRERRLGVSSRIVPAGVPGGAACVEIAVRDTGCGVPKALLDRIFDPFFTTKDAAGTGLGLSIAHQTVDGHGGRLTVQSEEGVGTTFVVCLPLSGGEPGAGFPTAGRDEVASRGADSSANEAGSEAG